MKNFILHNTPLIKTWLTKNYPLQPGFIERHEYSIDWNLLSQNIKIDYTLEFCEKYKDKLNWEKFNPLLSNQFIGEGRDDRLIAFVDHFKDKLNWHTVTQYLRIPENTEHLLNTFEDYWDWGNLCLLESIPWNINLLRKFRNKIVWGSISVNNSVLWKYEWIEEFEDLLDWFWFPHYSSYTWDGRSLKRFRQHLDNEDLKALSLRNWLYEAGPGTRTGQSGNPENENRVDPVAEEEFELNDDIASLEEVIDQLSQYFPQDEEIDYFNFIQFNLQTFSYLMSLDNVNQLSLATEAIIAEPRATLRKFGDILEWGRYSMVKSKDENGKEIEVMRPRGISANRNIVWTEELMDEFADRIQWNIFGKCGRMKWTKGMVEKYFERFDKDDILQKHALFHKLILPELTENLFELVFNFNKN